MDGRKVKANAKQPQTVVSNQIRAGHGTKDRQLLGAARLGTKHKRVVRVVIISQLPQSIYFRKGVLDRYKRPAVDRG